MQCSQVTASLIEGIETLGVDVLYSNNRGGVIVYAILVFLVFLASLVCWPRLHEAINSTYPTICCNCVLKP